jgi:hypothetical protein
MESRKSAPVFMGADPAFPDLLGWAVIILGHQRTDEASSREITREGTACSEADAVLDAMLDETGHPLEGSSVVDQGDAAWTWPDRPARPGARRAPRHRRVRARSLKQLGERP